MVSRWKQGAHTRVNAIDNTTESASSLAAGSDPHDPEERQPTDLKGKLGCKGPITDETEDEPEPSKHETQTTHGKLGTHMGVTEHRWRTAVATPRAE